jgi:hypothetical protein
MERRITTQTLIFRHPFWLAGFARDQAPGVYTIEIEQEALDTLSFPGWRHIATTIMLRQDGATECVPIDPLELEFALERDKNPDPADLL